MSSISVDGVDIGSLRHRVTIEAPRNAVDSAGDWTNDPVTGWDAVRTVYAQVLDVFGMLMQKVSKEYVDVRVLVRMRYQPDLTLSDAYRLNWNGKLFEIVYVDNTEGLNRLWSVYCREWQKNG